MRTALPIAVLALAACGPDAKADFLALTHSFKQISQGTVDARKASGFGATVALNGLTPIPFPGVPTTVTGGIDVLQVRTGTRAELDTDMDGDGQPGTGTAHDKIQAFSIAEGDFLAYSHPYKQTRVARCLAWQTIDRYAFLLIKDPFDPYVTVCTGTSGNDSPTTCQVCSPTACGASCGVDDPLQCGSPPKGDDGGIP